MLSEFESDESELLDDKDSVRPGVDFTKIVAFPGVAGVVDDCAARFPPPEVVAVAGSLLSLWVAKFVAFSGVAGVTGVVDDCAARLLPPEVVAVAGPLPSPWVAIIAGTFCAFFISPFLLKADLINSITGRCPW